MNKLKQQTIAENVFDILNFCYITLFAAACILPLVHILFGSLSNSAEVMRTSGLILYPLGGINFDGYKKIFSTNELVISFKNSIIYLLIGVTISMSVSILTAYVLSRKKLYFGKHLMIFMIIVMIFNAGLIPTYLVVRGLGLYNTMWAVILPQVISPFNVIILTNAFRGIPDSLEEAARIDGASHFHILYKIVVPVSLGTIVVILMFYSITNWNAYLNAMIYLRNKRLWPLQLLLREKLVAVDDATSVGEVNEELLKEILKYCYIVISTLPLAVIYPFIQKHIKRGVMIGSIKG